MSLSWTRHPGLKVGAFPQSGMSGAVRRVRTCVRQAHQATIADFLRERGCRSLAPSGGRIVELPQRIDQELLPGPCGLVPCSGCTVRHLGPGISGWLREIRRFFRSIRHVEKTIRHVKKINRRVEKTNRHVEKTNRHVDFWKKLQIFLSDMSNARNSMHFSRNDMSNRWIDVSNCLFDMSNFRINTSNAQIDMSISRNGMSNRQINMSNCRIDTSNRQLYMSNFEIDVSHSWIDVSNFVLPVETKRATTWFCLHTSLQRTDWAATRCAAARWYAACQDRAARHYAITRRDADGPWSASRLRSARKRS
jgi:hypothetical protein